MPVNVFYKKVDIALRILSSSAMNKLDLVGDKNRIKADKRRIKWLREQGYLKRKK